MPTPPTPDTAIDTSPRPLLIVDPRGRSIWDPVPQTYLGVAGPLGTDRVVSVLPTVDTRRL